MIRRITLVHLAFSVVMVLSILIFMGPDRALAATLGAATMGLNLISLIWAWQRIINKKSLVLAVGVIVFKYAILGLVLYLSVAKQLVDLVGFLMGLSTVFPSIIAWGYRENKGSEQT